MGRRNHPGQQSTDDRQGFIDQFSGSEHSMADYLAGEVMASLPASSRELLQLESVCDLLTTQCRTTVSSWASLREVVPDIAVPSAGAFGVHRKPGQACGGPSLAAGVFSVGYRW